MKPLFHLCLSACLCLFSLLPSTSHAQRLADSANACQLVKHPFNPPTVQRNALTIIAKSDEDCTVKLIDLLADSSAGRDHRQYLACLDALCWGNNAEINSHLKDVCAKLFHQNFNYLLEYNFKPNVEFNTLFEQTIIKGVAAEISRSKDPAADKAGLITFVHGKEQEMKMTYRQKAYAEALKDKILANIP